MSPIAKTPDIIIRPSGVWDTRAPFFQFISLHHQENQIYYALMLGVSKLLYDGRQLTVEATIPQFFNVKQAGKTASKAWNSYKKSFRKTSNDSSSKPTIQNALSSLTISISAITEYAITSYCGMFEAYMQCWALNFLLSILESGKPLDTKQRRLADGFSPIPKRGNMPNFHQICQAIPTIEEELKVLPHIFTDPTTGESVDTPITPNLNAFTAIKFWRDWRNLLVHSAGLVNSQFYDDHRRFWLDFKMIYPYISDFQVGKRPSLNDDIFRAVTTVHYRAARRLKDILVIFSSERRGHILAPEPEDKNLAPEGIPEDIPLMLIDGDHEPSYQWTVSKDYRKEYRDKLRELVK